MNHEQGVGSVIRQLRCSGIGLRDLVPAFYESVDPVKCLRTFFCFGRLRRPFIRRGSPPRRSAWPRRMKGRRSRCISLSPGQVVGFVVPIPEGRYSARSGFTPFFYPSVEPKWDDSKEDGLPYLQTSGADSRSGGKRARHILPGFCQIGRS